MWPRNRFPRPSPLCAPLTSPATSTNSMCSKPRRSTPSVSAIRSRRSSGTGTIATFGSTVVNGYSALSAPARVRALKSVDLPAFGRPTMPTFRGIDALRAEPDGLLAGLSSGRAAPEPREVGQGRADLPLEAEARFLDLATQLARHDHMGVEQRLSEDQPPAGLDDPRE